MKAMPTGDELLTSSEVAAIIKVDPATVLRWAKEGRLATAARTPGGRRRFRRSDVAALIDPDQAITVDQAAS